MLDTDATDHEAVFSQFQDGVENPTAFAIRTLSKSQKNYCVTRRELLVIVEFDKQHRHFLAKYRILHWNSSCPLSFVVLAKVPEGQLARWIEFLSTFDYEIQYRTEERQLNADVLSRRPYDVRCKWCKGWKSQKRLSFVDVSVQIVMSLTRATNSLWIVKDLLVIF